MSGKAKGKPHKGPAKEVYTLQNDCAAWNVDGSSTCKILFSSWISFWESKTGTSRGVCSFSSCNKTAEIGGHVWLKRKGPHIAPICSGCNYHKNVKRMQSSDGQHSFIKKGTTVVKVEFTEDMKNAVRRIAVNDKDMDEIDDESTNEESDESVISCVVDSLFESPSSHRQRGMFSAAFSRRSCAYCGVDISDRPATHDRCLSCFQEGSLSHRQRGMVSAAFSRRSCAYCGVDISDRPATHDRCLSCFRTKHYL